MSLMIGALLAASGHDISGVVIGLTLAGASLHWPDSLLFLVYVPPLAAFAFMAFFFHRTLRPGCEPLIVRIARKEHPELPQDMARYARRLTTLWTGCFIALFLVGLLLAPALALNKWSRWMQGLGYLVPLALFLGEHGYRRYRFPNRSHGSLRALIPNVVTAIQESARDPRASRRGASDLRQ